MEMKINHEFGTDLLLHYIEANNGYIENEQFNVTAYALYFSYCGDTCIVVFDKPNTDSCSLNITIHCDNYQDDIKDEVDEYLDTLIGYCVQYDEWIIENELKLK